MNAGSLFTGIGGFDLGLERAGHRILWQCEKDPYRRRVLARHWPGVPCWDDVVRLRESAERTTADSVRSSANGRGRQAWAGLPHGPDLLCGGFPCQDLSVAGRRAGLAGERSGLFFEFARIADAVLPSGGWILIENVPGLLSSPPDAPGRDFAVLLATLADLGFHDLAWRVLDSRYLGVPQRRRRLFILGRRARGQRASEVLLEPESGGGNFATGREARQGVAGSVADGADSARSLTANERWDADTEDFVASTIAKPLGAHTSGGGYRLDLDHETYVAHTLRAEGFDASEDGTGRGTPLIAAPLTAGGHPDSNAPGRRKEDDTNLVVGTVRSHQRPGSNAFDVVGFHTTQDAITEDDGVPALGGSRNRLGISTPADADGVREAAGIPGRLDRAAFDPKPDGARYAACGDAVTVNVAYWIGRRLHEGA